MTTEPSTPVSQEPSAVREAVPTRVAPVDHTARANGGRLNSLQNKAVRLLREASLRLRQRRVIAIILLVLVIGFAALIYAGVFFVVAGIEPDERPSQTINNLMMGAGVAAVLLLAAIGWVVARFFFGQRRERPGSRLSADLILQFAGIAIVPIVLSVVFAGTLFIGIESWFSERTQKVVENSRAVAEAYLEEHKAQILSNASVLASYINIAKPELEKDPQRFKSFLATQARLLKLLGTYMVNSNNEVLAGALDPSVDANVQPLPPEAFEAAAQRPIVSPNVEQNQVIALIKLEGYEDAYLFASRRIDPRVPELVAETEEAYTRYRVAEESRRTLQWLYGLTFSGMALVVGLVAVLMGLRSAKRIAEPLSRLVIASDSVSKGDLSARVEAGRGDDEVATLGRAFNRMTAELQAQRDTLVETHNQSDRRRRFIEAVMSGVTAGVIGLDTDGNITLTNKSALTLLGCSEEDLVGRNIRDAQPDIAPFYLGAKHARDQLAQGEVDLLVDGHTRNLLVRVTSESRSDESRGYVVTFDDITELVSAQRMSAWADVARRIAHEIKNPLTPIQLSAERLRRKYSKEITTQPEIFQQCTETIVRQVGDIGRMVDEFSSFARMPEAVMKVEDMNELVRQAAFLERVGHPDIEFSTDLPNGKMMVECDGRQVSQALINVLKNAAEAVGTRVAQDKEEGGESDPAKITTRATMTSNGLEIAIIDTGCGLPKDDRNRLTEPYMTTRAKGTGLGLAIVKKIMEDHGGALMLGDAPKEFAMASGRRGAMIRLIFPPEKVKSGEPAAATGDTGSNQAKDGQDAPAQKAKEETGVS